MAEGRLKRGATRIIKVAGSDASYGGNTCKWLDDCSNMLTDPTFKNQ